MNCFRVRRRAIISASSLGPCINTDRRATEPGLGKRELDAGGYDRGVERWPDRSDTGWVDEGKTVVE
jgi:hypothetical protein